MTNDEEWRQKQQASNNIARARDLQSQINHWQQQLAQDPNHSHAAGTIDGLMRELAGIPSHHR